MRWQTRACAAAGRGLGPSAAPAGAARALAGALVRSELLTQGEIFQDECLSMDEEAAQEASEQGHPGILAGVGKSNDFRLDGVFADYGWIAT